MVNLHPSGRASYHLEPAPPASSNQSSQSLADQLSKAFSSFLKQSGVDPSGFKLSVQPSSGTVSAPVSGQSNNTTQNPVTKPSDAPAKLGFNALIPPDTIPLPAQRELVNPVQHWYGPDAADDAYWSKQPPAVQQLREIDDTNQRAALGKQLAVAGYQIDVPIMVWGWDAAKTTALRAEAGYTWVPSAQQNPVSAAPGLTGPGITPYDPKNPPANSIKV